MELRGDIHRIYEALKKWDITDEETDEMCSGEFLRKGIEFVMRELGGQCNPYMIQQILEDEWYHR